MHASLDTTWIMDSYNKMFLGPFHTVVTEERLFLIFHTKNGYAMLSKKVLGRWSFL